MGQTYYFTKQYTCLDIPCRYWMSTSCTNTTTLFTSTGLSPRHWVYCWNWSHDTSTMAICASSAWPAFHQCCGRAARRVCSNVVLASLTIARPCCWVGEMVWHVDKRIIKISHVLLLLLLLFVFTNSAQCCWPGSIRQSTTLTDHHHHSGADRAVAAQSGAYLKWDFIQQSERFNSIQFNCNCRA